MKGFPNQIADLGKLAQGLRCIEELLDASENPRDDGVLGEAMVRAGVLGTGHTPIPIESYLKEQRTKSPSNQSFRTSARGLRELYRLLGMIDDAGSRVVVTPEGQKAARFAGQTLGTVQIEFWRRAILNFSHYGGDSTESHPYQVMLRLIARKPGIPRAKCALALEAKDDSPEELERIVRLANLPEDRIRSEIRVSKSNWDNAKKVIPRFAEQLDDVIKTGQSYRLAEFPGLGNARVEPRTRANASSEAIAPRRPQMSRVVTPDTIALAGIAEQKEPPVPADLDPAAATAAKQQRADRLRRHNLLVRELASRLSAGGMALYADPFDVLAVQEQIAILSEIKTLDGTPQDERERVREAFGQLCYYEAFVAEPITSGATIQKIACFERSISMDHQRWLNRAGIAAIWWAKGRFAGDELAAKILGGILEELR